MIAEIIAYGICGIALIGGTVAIISNIRAFNKRQGRSKNYYNED